MYRRYSAALFVVCIGITNVQAEDLTCSGPFAEDTDHNRLVQTFGRQNVTMEAIPGAEGADIKASVIFPKDEARRIEVIWHNERARRNPSIIQTAGQIWIGPKSIRVGTPMAEVEVANGKPFKLYGFRWDFGGTVSDWREGALARINGGCSLIVVFSPDDAASEEALAKVGGDTEFDSSSRAMKAVKPRIDRMSIGYPAPGRGRSG